MKNLLIITLLSISNLCSGQEYNSPEYSTDSTYGYTPLNPMSFGSDTPFINLSYARGFFYYLRTSDNKKLKLLPRGFSVHDPRYTEEQANQKIEKDKVPCCRLDCYTLTTKDEKVKVKLYVDVYSQGNPQVPVGLKWQD